MKTKEIQLFLFFALFIAIQIWIVSDLNKACETIQSTNPSEEQIFPVYKEQVIVNSKSYPVEQFKKEVEVMWELRENFEKEIEERVPEEVFDLLVKDDKPFNLDDVQNPELAELSRLMDLFERFYPRYRTEIKNILRKLERKRPKVFSFHRPGSKSDARKISFFQRSI